MIEPMLTGAEARSRNILIVVSLSGLFGCALLIGFMMLVERHSADRAEADRRTYYMAAHDMLTGLGNRSQLQQAVDAVFSPDHIGPRPALILIDLDKFKPINDTFGHAVGDRILTLVAGRMRALCAREDLVARLGGDEFAVLVADGQSVERIETLANRLCHVLSEPFDVDGHKLGIGASAGVAFAGGDAGNTTDLMVAADLALYAAKAAGRGCAHLYRPELMAAALKRRRLEADLREALKKGELELYYQPIVRADTGDVTRMEALMRWRHAELGFISPADFIPLAEETGQIVALGAWAIQTACADIASLGGDVSVAVNLSPVQIRHESLIGTIRAALAESALAPHRFEVEITEGVLLENDRQTLEVLHTIRSLGVGIALDDFGTGYSCLSYLQHYPITCIKVDRSFVSTLGQEKGARPIISTVVALAHNLGMFTVAEGVETDAQLRELTELGCDEVQGFYLGKPKPLAELRPTLKVSQSA
ncbi:MAG: EAL domain-containing protein [Proteobacteria bacterium]|nr:EAL domain-containing protein [Pseudomonadota bacterium]